MYTLADIDERIVLFDVSKSLCYGKPIFTIPEIKYQSLFTLFI